MFLSSLNKTGLGTILVLLLLGLSLDPTCGRPSFKDEDDATIADEDHEEEDENQVDDPEAGLQDEDEDVEHDTTAVPEPQQECTERFASETDPNKKKSFIDSCKEKIRAAKNKLKSGGGSGGSSGGGTGGAAASASDEYDE